jgi:hypothetical protein
MFMPAKLEPDAWSEVRDVLLRWEALTGELERSLDGGHTESLPPLLKERRQLCDRLDALKEGHGAADWSGRLAQRRTAVQEEIEAILERLAVKEERVRQELASRMSALKQKIAGIRQIRTANQAYLGRRRAVKGAFIDARR